MNERTWLCNGSGHASGVAVLMKAEKADGKVERHQVPVEGFGCDELDIELFTSLVTGGMQRYGSGPLSSAFPGTLVAPAEGRQGAESIR